MEIRKVQVTGGSSYVITLPKEWIKENKIEKNHNGQVSSNGTTDVDPIVELQAEEFADKMSEYREFWGY